MLAVAMVVIAGTLSLLLTHAASAIPSGQLSVFGGAWCLDDNSAAIQRGNKVQLWQCNGSTAQRWDFYSDRTIRLHANTTYCLDVMYAGTVQATKVWLYPCNGTVAQQWSTTKNSDGTTAFINPHANMCLDDDRNIQANGNKVQIWPCNKTGAQRWTMPAPSPTPVPTPNPSPSCAPSGVCAPVGDLPGWKQRYVTNFPGTVPVGAFSDCDHNTASNTGALPYCNGLKPYGAYFNEWWAYPTGWPDTAMSGADGNTGAPFGGYYHPETVVSVDHNALHIHMYRPSRGGANYVATVVPIKCMQQKYGRYTERFKVVHEQPGFKSAHLFYQGGFEIDYPENDYGATISAYTHPGEANFSTSAKWTDWHTTAIEWTAGVVKFYMDGRLIGSSTARVPNIPMDWILQNESSIMGPYAAPGASAQLDIAWVACYTKQ